MLILKKEIVCGKLINFLLVNRILVNFTKITTLEIAIQIILTVPSIYFLILKQAKQNNHNRKTASDGLAKAFNSCPENYYVTQP